MHADPEHGIIVTPSAKHALFITLATVLEPGDEVSVPTPSWVSYAPMVQLLGAQAVSVPLDPKDEFTLTSDRLEEKMTGRTRAILINTPKQSDRTGSHRRRGGCRHTGGRRARPGSHHGRDL